MTTYFESFRTKGAGRQRTAYILISSVVIIFCQVLFMTPFLLLTKSTERGLDSSTTREKKINDITSNIPHATNSSTAPLFYHISPGSTGSRTLYHAACHAGFPSVHHKSFCISRSRGILGVTENIVVGARAHYEVLRLYQMAMDCCSLWAKGRLLVDGDVEESLSKLIEICNIPTELWAGSIQRHLETVIQSGLVGLFDTPYPYLAPQVLDLAHKFRISSPIIAMSERNPIEWADSRIRNHGLLLCRKEYSLEGLGSSEFDILGCVSRAYKTNQSNEKDPKMIVSTLENHYMLQQEIPNHFWDVFEHHSHHDEVEHEFQIGMERQMERHQTYYKPRSHYTPSFFGGKNSSSAEKTQRSRADERHISAEIRSHILSVNQTWLHDYDLSLTCRGRVAWEMKNDSFNELYHLPKTCESGRVGYFDGKVFDDKNFIPLLSSREVVN